MAKTKIYLAGKMSGLTFEEMNGWRKRAEDIFASIDDNIHPENPCRYYNFQDPEQKFTDTECKTFDLWLVQNCDVILVNLEYPDTIGTAIELELASRLWGKPIIAFGANENLHPWMKLTVTKFCDNLVDAIDHIVYFYHNNI